MLIDSHAHVWRLAAPEVEWPGPDLPQLYRDFDMADFWRTAAPSGVTGTILVQSQPDERDTAWLLDVASRDSGVVGVVGWADLLAMNAASRIADLASNPKLVGLRPMLQDLPIGWILNPELEPAIEAMIEASLRFDALVRVRHLSALHAFAKRWPKLGIVIDHGAKPDIAAGSAQAWCDGLSSLARLPNVWCKLSGLLTEMGSTGSQEAVVPYVEFLIDSFGPERLMWGSDWPVLTLAGDYEGWERLARRIVGSYGAKAEAQVFGLTAHQFYGARHRGGEASGA